MAVCCLLYLQGEFMNRITEDHVKSLIKQENIMYVRDCFYPKSDSTMTICILRLANGYEVVGQSSCVDPVNFDKELGASIGI